MKLDTYELDFEDKLFFVSDNKGTYCRTDDLIDTITKLHTAIKNLIDYSVPCNKDQINQWVYLRKVLKETEIK